MAHAQSTDDYLDLIRQLISGDHEAYRRRCATLDRTGWEGLGLVVGAAFYRAVHGRFGGDGAAAGGSGEIIRFVADARARLEGAGFDLDPGTAEAVVRAALDAAAAPIDDLDPATVVQAELLLLWPMLAPLTARELDTFLSASGKLADSWRRNTAIDPHG